MSINKKQIRITLSSVCTVETCSAPLKAEISRAFIIANPKYAEAEKYGRSTRDIEPQLKFYKTINANCAEFPRGAANWLTSVAAQYSEIEKIDQRLTLPEINLSFNGKLRPYQQQAVNNVLHAWAGVLEAGTGSGKTVMALAVIAKRKQPTLILVHTKELLYQWRDRIRTFLGIEAGLIGAGKFEVRPVTVGIVNTVKKHLDALPDQFGHLIVDECHRVPASMYTETVKEFRTPYMLGLSATPYRRDKLNKLIGWYVGMDKVTVNANHLRETGAILKPKIIWRKTDFHYIYDDDYQAMITALVKDHQRNYQIAADVQNLADSGTCLVVSDRVDHLNRISSLLKAKHLILTGKTPVKQRQEIVDRVKAGEVQVLLSTLSLIGEGFDCAGLTNLFITTPIRFKGRLNQVIGRILRPADGKQPIIFDYVDSNVGLLKNTAQARSRIYALAA